MRGTVVAMIGVGAMAIMVSGCTSKKELIRATNISLTEAVRTAEASVTDGRAIEAELEKEDGRAMYEVELIDAKMEKRKVHIDAGTGKVFKID